MKPKSAVIEVLETRMLLTSVPAFKGAVTVPGTLNDYNDSFASVKITPDGKIVAVGKIQATADSLTQWAVFEFNADGSLNASFGDNGQAPNPFPGTSQAVTVKIENDLNDSGYTILVGGSNTIIDPQSPKKYEQDIALARYTSGGQLDTSFNGAGTVTRNPGSLSNNLNSLLIDSDGTILVAGTTYVGRKVEPFVVKLDPDGTPYENSASPFGEDGVEIFAFDKDATGAELETVPDGAGPANSFYLIAFGADNYVARGLESGALDPTFGSAIRGSRSGFTKLPTIPGGPNAVFGIDAANPTGVELALAGSSARGISRIAFEKLTNMGTADTAFSRRNGVILARANFPAKAAPHGAIFIDDNTVFTFGYTYTLPPTVKTTDLVYQEYVIAGGAVSADPAFNSGVPIVETIAGNSRFNGVTEEPAIGPDGQTDYVFAGDLKIFGSKPSDSRHILALYRIFADGQTDPSFTG